MEVISRTHNILAHETYTILNPEADRKGDLVNRAFDDCTQNFYRSQIKCAFAIKSIHETHGITYCFLLKNSFNFQKEEMNEAN